MKYRYILSAITMTAALASSAVTPLWLRDVKISPDGKTIAFTYKGDIFTVPAAGGQAKQLTTQTSYEANPVWSPDSRSIAFASDRHGNMDVFVMDAGGGEARRLTTNSAAEVPESFSPDGTQVYYSAYIQKPAASSLYPSARMTELYAVGVEGGRARQILSTPAKAVAFMPDGQSFLYYDVKGLENEWRKHHTSSATRDIWLYDARSGKHTNLTDRGGEDRDPTISADGKTVYFLSERNGGSFNVYSFDIDNPSAVTAVTAFSTHPVRFLSRSDDGTLAFTYNGEIYTLGANASEPSKVAIELTSDRSQPLKRVSVTPNGGVPSHDGEQFVYRSRGNLFATSVEYPSTKQITTSPAMDEEPTWSADGRSVVFTSMRDGYHNLYKSSIAQSSDPNFSNATVVEETPLFSDGIERQAPQFSPDGKKLAFIQDRNKLMVMDVATKKVTPLTDGETWTFRNETFGYEWSPDSKWIVMEALGNRHDPYTDIALINAETGALTYLTRTGYFDARPRFAMQGNAVIFSSDRYGMRNHASWGSQDDIMMIFLNRDAYNKFTLSEEDYALLKEAEKKAAKKDEKDTKADKKKDSKKDKEDKADKKPAETAVNVELDKISDRIVRLTPYSSDIADAFVDADGKTLYYLSSVEEGYDLWKMDLRDREPKIVSKLDEQRVGFALTPDGKKAFIIGDKIRKFDTGSDKITPVKTSAQQIIDPAAEREAMFNDVCLTERETFYTEDMHGVDWDAMTENYRRFLPHIDNNYDFAEMLSELLGELNVSHTGSGYRGNEANDLVDRTARLGLLYDLDFDGDGLRVAEIIRNGPFDKPSTALAPGAVITAINGLQINADTDFAALFNNIAGQKTLVSFITPDGAAVSEVVRPISAGDENGLMYERWVKSRAAYVDSISNGRLAYVHLDSMDDENFRRAYADLLGKYNQREGAVVDIRWNGGGRLHEDIEVLLSGNQYFTQVVRGQESCSMPSRRWNKPSIMVINEACYSNAHGTPWVYKNRGLGRLVGMPVAGTMTSVNWKTLQDPTLYFGIPVIGYRLPDGSYLENTQLEPDIRVVNTPESVARGEDLQLRAAVEALLRQIDGN